MLPETECAQEISDTTSRITDFNPHSNQTKNQPVAIPPISSLPFSQTDFSAANLLNSSISQPSALLPRSGGTLPVPNLQLPKLPATQAPSASRSHPLTIATHTLPSYSLPEKKLCLSLSRVQPFLRSCFRVNNCNVPLTNAAQFYRRPV